MPHAPSPNTHSLSNPATQNSDFTPTPTPPQHLPTSPQTEARPARRRLPFTRTARSSSLFPSGLDPELKARCYERLLEPTTANDQDIPSEKRKREVSPESMLNQDQNVPEKRKREVSPDYIPNPKGSSYGMDDDFFTYTEEEYAEEEKRQAEEAKHKAEQAENAQAGAPSAKKARVNAPQWPRRRTAKNRPEKGNTSNPPPSKQPGFEKNSRRTYAPPDLETILSSRLFDEDDINLPAGSDSPTTSIQNQRPAEAVADPKIVHSDSNSAPPGECSVLDPSSTPSFSCPETTDRHTQGRVFVPNPHGTFETPYSSDSETEEPTDADYANEASDLNRQDIQAQPLDSQNVTSTPNTNSTLLETPHSSFPAHNGPGTPPLISGTATTHIESSTISALLSPPRISGEDDLLPPYPVQRQSVLQRERSDTTINRLTDTEAPMPFTSDPLDELPDVIVKFNPGGTQADEMTVAAVSDSDDASPLTRARSKAEQFKPKTPSRLREAHRFSSSMTQMSPFTPNKTSNTDFEHPEPENHPGFRSLEDMMADCDADWLYGQCPSGDLRQLKWPKKISLTEQIRSHGIDSADEDIAIADEAWNDPAQFQRDLEAMRAVLATSMNKPVGSPIDWSSWDSRLQQ